MKMFKLIALISLIAFIAAITVAYFTYYKTTHIGGEQGVTPAWYSKNMFSVYISRKGSGGFPTILTERPKTSQIEGADYDTFEYIDDGFAKDKNYFYYPDGDGYKIEKKIELNPAKPLRIVSVELSDTSLLYRKYYILPDAVLHVMKYNPAYYASSGNSFARLGLMKGSNINNPVWYPFDYETFTPFPCGYLKDKNGVYTTRLSGLSIVDDVDIESFTANYNPNSRNSEDSCYATDKNYQYYYSRGGKYNELEVLRKPIVYNNQP
jgi:hypothetical protein